VLHDPVSSALPQLVRCESVPSGPQNARNARGLRQLGLVPEAGSRGERVLVLIQRLAARLRRIRH
jgi:hypothetical protein